MDVDRLDCDAASGYAVNVKAEYHRSYYQRRLAAGLCGSCGKSRDDLARAHCTSCRERNTQTAKQRRAEHRRNGQCTNCSARASGVYCATCRTAYTQSGKAARQRLRRDVLIAYGDRCACCGESNSVFLTIDHVNGTEVARSKMKKPRATVGISLCRELRRRGYPKGFQILCWNCNWAKEQLGQCPHQA